MLLGRDQGRRERGSLVLGLVGFSELLLAARLHERPMLYLVEHCDVAVVFGLSNVITMTGSS